MEISIFWKKLGLFCIPELDSRLTPLLCSTFAEYLDLREKQFREKLSPETIVASLEFILDEPNPVETVKRAINKPQKVFKQFLPDADFRSNYGKIPAKKRYAVRSSRKLRSNPDNITDTVFIPRSKLLKLIEEAQN